jgi:hypothetical protein
MLGKRQVHTEYSRAGEEEEATEPGLAREIGSV